MSQKTSGLHKIFSYPFFYSLTQKIMSGVSTRGALVKNIINLRGKSPGKQLRTTNASVESSTSIGESVST